MFESFRVVKLFFDVFQCLFVFNADMLNLFGFLSFD
jgi:hypothetical protein